MNGACQLLKEELARHFSINSQNIFLFWKGRVALFAILKAINIEEGAEVILPGFTCVVVPNAIKYLGAKPVYVDIDPRTYNVDPKRVERKITRRTKAILAQNTFGLSSDLDPLLEIARRYNLHVIEDCAHGLGGEYKGRRNGTVAEAAFFSTQWSKPFSTGLGGFAVTTDVELAERLKEEEDTYSKPNILEKSMLGLLLKVHELFMNPTTYWPSIKLYRSLSKLGLLLGSSSADELKSPVKPDDFEKGFTELQAKRALRELKDFNATIEHRRRIASLYDDILERLGLPKPYQPDYAFHTFLKYPLEVRDSGAFFKEAFRHRIEIGDWFLSPLHPIIGDLSVWDYSSGTCPIAETISQRIVNLPTHKRIDEKYVDRLEGFLGRMRRKEFL